VRECTRARPPSATPAAAIAPAPRPSHAASSALHSSGGAVPAGVPAPRARRHVRGALAISHRTSRLKEASCYVSCASVRCIVHSGTLRMDVPMGRCSVAGRPAGARAPRCTNAKGPHSARRTGTSPLSAARKPRMPARRGAFLSRPSSA